jgi:hypothetical protein
MVQTCIVHLIRHSMYFLPEKTASSCSGAQDRLPRYRSQRRPGGCGAILSSRPPISSGSLAPAISSERQSEKQRKQPKAAPAAKKKLHTAEKVQYRSRKIVWLGLENGKYKRRATKMTIGSER